MKFMFTVCLIGDYKNTLGTTPLLPRVRVKNYRWLNNRFLVFSYGRDNNRFNKLVPRAQFMSMGEYRLLALSSKNTSYGVNGSTQLKVVHRYRLDIPYKKFVIPHLKSFINILFCLSLYKHLNNSIVTLQIPVIRLYLSSQPLVFAAVTPRLSANSTRYYRTPRFLTTKL